MMLTMVIMKTMVMVTLLLLLVRLFAVLSLYRPPYHDPATVEPCRGPGSNKGDCTQAAEQSGRQRQPKVSSRMSPLPQVSIRFVFAFIVGDVASGTPFLSSVGLPAASLAARTCGQWSQASRAASSAQAAAKSTHAAGAKFQKEPTATSLAMRSRAAQVEHC